MKLKFEIKAITGHTIWGVIIGIAVLISLPAIYLGYGLTTSRVALLLLIVLFILSIQKPIQTTLFLPLIGAFAASIVYFFSFAIGNDSKTVFNGAVFYHYPQYIDNNNTNNCNLFSNSALKQDANDNIWHMPEADNISFSYREASEYGTWNGNTIWEVTVSDGTLPTRRYASLRRLIPSVFSDIFGNTRRFSTKVKMLEGELAALSLHNMGGTRLHDPKIFYPIERCEVPTTVLIKDGWHQMDADVTITNSVTQNVGIGILSPGISFLATEMMLYPSTSILPFTVDSCIIVIGGKNLWLAFTWIMLGLQFALLAYCVSRLNLSQNKAMAIVMYVAVLVIWSIILFLIFETKAGITNHEAIRSMLQRVLPLGLNRFMNMMVVLTGIVMGTLYLKERRNVFHHVLYIIPVSLLIYFSFLAGSRQSIIAIVIIIALIITIGTGLNKEKLKIALLITVSLILIIFALFWAGLIDSEWINQRFFSVLQGEELDYADSMRLYVAQIAWEAARFGGLGPGNFPQTGLYPHNGYLGFLAEAGLIKGGIALLAIWGIIIYTFIRLRRRHDLSPLARSAWVVFLVLATVMNMFNDLFREPIYWAKLGLAVGASVASPVRGEAAPAEDGENDMNHITPNAG